MSSADGLCKNHGDVYNLDQKEIEAFDERQILRGFAQGAEIVETHLYFGTVFHLLLLWNCVGDHHSFKTGIVDA